jgi:hypothetical protein
MRAARTLRPAVVLTLALFLATGIGVPVHHHADHHGGETHVTAGEHGHGATLVVRDMRTERPEAAVDVPAASAITALSEPAVTGRRTASRAPSTPRGRSPPASCRPRAPPPSS